MGVSGALSTSAQLTTSSSDSVMSLPVLPLLWLLFFCLLCKLILSNLGSAKAFGYILSWYYVPVQRT